MFLKNLFFITRWYQEMLARNKYRMKEVRIKLWPEGLFCNLMFVKGLFLIY